MKIKLNFGINRIVDFLVMALLCSFTILTTYSWGRYLMIICLAGIFVLDAAQSKFRYRFFLSRFSLTVALLSLYAFLSSAWSINPSDAFVQGRTLFELLMMVFVVEHYYQNREDNVSSFSAVIKWSSFIIVIYTIFAYGIDSLMLVAKTAERLENTYANINTIGILASVGTVIQIDEMFREKKWKIAGLMCIPSVFLIAVTQSRKALLILLLGSFFSFVTHNTNSKNWVKNLLKVVISVVAAGVFVYFLLSMPMFEGVLDRMEKMFAVFEENAYVDYSTRLREQMVIIGWEQFLKTPLFGVGMGNAHYLALDKMNYDAYLHNNFIELLAGGGLVGFLIYYSMYFYLVVTFWRYRKYKNPQFKLCFIIMILLFVMDYGRVSYSTKMNYIFMLLYFLEARALQKAAHQSQKEMVE